MKNENKEKNTSKVANKPIMLTILCIKLHSLHLQYKKIKMKRKNLVYKKMRNEEGMTMALADLK